MKNILVLSFIFLVALTFHSCSPSLPKRMDSFVSNVEKHSSSFSRDDWKEANDKFMKLLNEYVENRNSFSAEEKKQINSAIVTYGKVAAKSGLKDVAEMAREIQSQLSSIQESFEDAKSWIKEILE